MVSPDNDECTYCIACSAALSRGSKFCTKCERFQGDSCIMCAEPLPSNKALVCNSCGLHQNKYVRTLQWVGSSAIVSVIPLIVVAWAYLGEISKPNESRVEVAAVSCVSSGIELFARNTGNRPAVILEKATFKVIGKQGTHSEGSLYLEKGQTNAAFIAGESGNLLKYTPATIGPVKGSIKMKDVEECKIVVSLEITEFEGQPVSKEFTCQCAE